VLMKGLPPNVQMHDVLSFLDGLVEVALCFSFVVLMIGIYFFASFISTLITNRRAWLWFCHSVWLSPFSKNASSPAVLIWISWYFNAMQCSPTWNVQVVLTDSRSRPYYRRRLSYDHIAYLERVVRSTSCLILGAYCRQRANHIASLASGTSANSCIRWHQALKVESKQTGWLYDP